VQGQALHYESAEHTALAYAEMVGYIKGIQAVYDVEGDQDQTD